MIQGGDAVNPSFQTLLSHGTQFNFSNVQPAAVLWSVVNLKTLDQAAGNFRREGFIERSFE